MDPGPYRIAASWTLGALAVAYVDAPFRTLGQDYQAHRWAERLVLLSIETNLILIWALAKILLQRDAAIVPANLEAPLAIVGAGLAWAGTLFTLWAKFTLGRWFSVTFAVKRGHELIVRGPYAIVRHPMYAGLLATTAGFALAWNSQLTLVLALLLIVPLAFHTAVEEQLFVAHFGDAYRQYQQRVPRLMPGWPGKRAR